MKVAAKQGMSLYVLREQDRFSFNCSHFSSHDLSSTAHDFELIPRKSTVVNVDLVQAGIGSNSCGPKLHEKYLLNHEKYHFSVRLLLCDDSDICPFEQTGC